MTANDFRVGDTVVSPIGNIGTVRRIADGAMTVTYRERGQSWETTYSAEWFETWGRYLKNLGRQRGAAA